MSTNAVMHLACGDPEVYGWYDQYNIRGPFYPTHTYVYPTILNTSIVVDDKAKKAFAIAKQLVKEKRATAVDIDEFVQLVEMIESHL